MKRDFIFSEVWFLTFLQYSWVTLELLVELLLYSPQTGRESHPFFYAPVSLCLHWKL